VLSSEFRYDMRLQKIIGCVGSNTSGVLGLTFVLQTTTADPSEILELESLGYRYGSNCKEVLIEEDQFISYLEVTFDNNRINSFFTKLGGNTNVLFGARAPGD